VPSCHQCNKDTGTDGRSGDCKVCYSKGVDFCQKCAMWELGPVDADVDLAAALRKAKTDLSVQRQDRDKPKSSVSKIGDEPLACDLFFATMETVCPFFKDQLTNAQATLYGKQFKVYSCDVLDKFRDLYKTCKFDRLALQVLIVMFLSSQERVQCRTSKDANGESSSAHAKPVKRWQTRTIAKNHLANHLGEVETAFGKTIRDIVERPAWQLALGSDDLELFLKGFKHPTLAAIDLLAAAGSVEVAREALEVFVIVYHALTATRPRATVKAHWSTKEASFTAKEALGFLSEDHFVHLYGDVSTAAAFSDETTARIERLWNVLGDGSSKNELPAHPRYPDGTISGNGLLDDPEKAYLQYLPTFDHPHAQRASRTPCEIAVRTRVLATLKNYLGDYGPARWFRAPDLVLSWKSKPEVKGRTKTLTVEDPRRGDVAPITITFGASGTHATQTLSTTEKAKITPFLQSLLTPDDLRAHGCRVEIQITGEQGNTRRDARRKAVEDAVKEAFDAEKADISWRPTIIDGTGALKGDAALDPYLDDLCAAMKTTFCVDQAFDAGVSKMIVGNSLTGGTFTPKAWFPLKTKDVAFSTLFPDCSFDPIDLPTIDDHYEAVQGSSPRPAHYMDWRNHKDLWLYDCFAIAQRRRPVFGSLSVQPYLPAPNPNYGGHILYYKRPETVGRAVYTFGDKQQPRRSMLLLLDTILHGRKKKDGAAAQDPARRQKVFYELLWRFDTITFYAGWSAERLWQRAFEASNRVAYPDGDLLLECQIFGGLTLTTDAWGFVPAVEDAASVYYIAKDHLKTTDLQAAQAQLAAVYPNVTVLSYEPSKMPKPGAHPSQDAWKSHLSEIAE
jgi:hypothetical protein